MVKNSNIIYFEYCADPYKRFQNEVPEQHQSAASGGAT